MVVAIKNGDYGFVRLYIIVITMIMNMKAFSLALVAFFLASMNKGT